MMHSESSSTEENSTTSYNNGHESYARSLRVIGQALESLRITSFALEKDGDKFIVRNWEPSFLNNIANQVWGSNYCAPKPAHRKSKNPLLIYDEADTERLETVGRGRRGSTEIQKPYKISSGLRVLGDYLDQHRATNFHVWWSTESVTIKYQATAGTPKEANFTVQNLHDLAVGMYIRRSGRSSK
jgi:hypothetical protein